MNKKDKSNIQEALSTLYLRLNGYFTTGFIIHSSGNKISGELDILAVRFPNHNQDDTEHNSSVFLEVPETIDLIIAEIKSNGQSLQFNNCLIKEDNSSEVWSKILKWSGIMTQSNIKHIIPKLIALIKPSENSKLPTLKIINLKTTMGFISIRPIIFSPERIEINNADKFITWSEINDFIWKCLCPVENNKKCGSRYDFTAWGTDLYEIVKVYKEKKEKLTSIDELYLEIKNLRTKSNIKKA